MDTKVNPPESQEQPAIKWAGYFALAWPKVRDSAIKFAMLKFLPRIISGPWGWVATTLLTWSVDYVIKPLYDYTVRKIIVLVKKQSNNQAGKDVQNSKTEGEFDSATDNLP